MKLFTVGSRGSRLALAQTEWVMGALKALHPDVEFEVKVIKTKGDEILDKALDKIGEKGLFIKELEQALLDCSIDFAVHSMKDMPSQMTEGLSFAGVPLREDPRDVLVLRQGLERFEDLPEGAILGTGSQRRIQQLKALRPDLRFIPVRGNIETRMRKIETEGLDGVVLAAAGLKRLDLSGRVSVYLPEAVCLPAPAQGALAIQYRTGDYMMEALFKDFSHEASEVTAHCERGFLEAVGGSCHVPVGAWAQLEGGLLKLSAVFGSSEDENQEGGKLYRWQGETRLPETGDKLGPAKALGALAAREIRREMAEDGL